MVKQMIMVFDKYKDLTRSLVYYNEEGYRLVNVCVIDGRVTSGSVSGGYGTVDSYGHVKFLAIFDYVGVDKNA